MEERSTGDGNKETLNIGGDVDQHQVECLPSGEPKAGTEGQGGLQQGEAGDPHIFREESSDGDAGASSAAHSYTTVGRSNNLESCVDLPSAAVAITESEGQPNKSGLLTEGASQHTARAEEREATSATDGTNRVSGSQNGDNHLQATKNSVTVDKSVKMDSGQAENLAEGAPQSNAISGEESEATSATNSINQASGSLKGNDHSQAEGGDGLTSEDKSKKDRSAKTEPEEQSDNLTITSSQCTVLREEGSRETEGTKSEGSELQKGDHYFVQAKSGNDDTSTGASSVTHNAEMESADRQPDKMTNVALQDKELEGESKVTSVMDDTNRCDQVGGAGHLDGATVTATDEKDARDELKVQLQTELKQDRLVISLISKDLFKHTKVDIVTTAPQSIENEGTNISMTKKETKVAWYSERERLGTFDLEDFFMQDPETADQWEQLDRRAIRILVTGKTGTGKSALINGLIGRNVTIEGDTLDPTTARVEQIKQMVHGISMSVFDSPGLQDGTSREQEYLQDMQQKCERVDLVLYTIKMTDQRVHAADTKAMKKITDAFGHKFWEKAVFVMTFANEVRSPEYPDDDYENRKYFDKRLQDWIDQLPSIIEQRGDIPLNIGKHVPIVPAGYYKIRDLPGRKFWFSQFWKSALDRMMESSAEGAGYMLQFSQDRLKHYSDTTEEDFEKPIHEQPILSKIVDE